MHANDNTTPEFREAVARFADTLNTVAGNPEPENGALPYFFHALERQRWGKDHCGANWDQPLPARQASKLARTHRQASGLSAVARLLLADFETQECGSEEPQLTPHLREGLFLALTELADEVHGALSVIGEQLERPEPTGDRA